jgi:predicted RNA-binding protein with PUA-like domain
MNKEDIQNNFGAWVLRCNPDIYDLPREVEDGLNLVDTWSVSENYRTEMMAPGNPVLLWMSGTKIGGIWGIGRVAGPAIYLPDFRKNQFEYWKTDKAKAANKLYAQVEIAIIRNVVPEFLIKQNKVLANSEIVKQPQLANPSCITSEEFVDLKKLLNP